MKYAVNYFIYNGKPEHVLFDFVPPNETLTCFLVDDFSAFKTMYLDAIDKVLRGESGKEELTGNSSYIEFGPVNTFLENLFPADDNVPETCTLDTKELRQVMDEWLEAERKRKEAAEKPQDGAPAAEGKGETR